MKLEKRKKKPKDFDYCLFLGFMFDFEIQNYIWDSILFKVCLRGQFEVRVRVCLLFDLFIEEKCIFKILRRCHNHFVTKHDTEADKRFQLRAISINQPIIRSTGVRTYSLLSYVNNTPLEISEQITVHQAHWCRSRAQIRLRKSQQMESAHSIILLEKFTKATLLSGNSPLVPKHEERFFIKKR